MADARKGQVHPGYQRFTGSHGFHDAAPGGDGLFLVDVKLDGNAWDGKLYGVGMHQVAPDQQLLPFRLKTA